MTFSPHRRFFEHKAAGAERLWDITTFRERGGKRRWIEVIKNINIVSCCSKCKRWWHFTDARKRQDGGGSGWKEDERAHFSPRPQTTKNICGILLRPAIYTNSQCSCIMYVPKNVGMWHFRKTVTACLQRRHYTGTATDPYRVRTSSLFFQNSCQTWAPIDATHE